MLTLSNTMNSFQINGFILLSLHFSSVLHVYHVFLYLEERLRKQNRILNNLNDLILSHTYSPMGGRE